MNLTTDFHLVRWLRMSGAILPRHYTPSLCGQGQLYLWPRFACQRFPIACSPRPQHVSACRSVSRSVIETSAQVSRATFRRFASACKWLIRSLIIFNCIFGRFRGSRKKRPRTSPCPSVLLPVCMCQFGSYWTDFREVWYRTLSWKSSEKNHEVRPITGRAGPEMG
jgi:hypothetical protein